MAKTKSWGYTNTTTSLTTVPVVEIGEYSNYARIKDDPGMTQMSNRTSVLDQMEKVTFKSAADTYSRAKLANPAPNSDACFYSCKVEDILRVSDSVTGGDVDYPITCTITFKHAVTDQIGNADILNVLSRSMGALYDTTNSKWRFEDLMRGATAPIND
jgi:hypothetical protein